MRQEEMMASHRPDERGKEAHQTRRGETYELCEWPDHSTDSQDDQVNSPRRHMVLSAALACAAWSLRGSGSTDTQKP
jgi:hypothetical protein